jgi:hypothetical protein
MPMRTSGRKEAVESEAFLSWWYSNGQTSTQANYLMLNNDDDDVEKKRVEDHSLSLREHTFFQLSFACCLLACHFTLVCTHHRQLITLATLLGS